MGPRSESIRVQASESAKGPRGRQRRASSTASSPVLIGQLSRSLVRGRYWQSAEQGVARAQLALARCMLRGLGLAADVPRALAWLRRAAEQGDVDAMAEVGTPPEARARERQRAPP